MNNQIEVHQHHLVLFGNRIDLREQASISTGKYSGMAADLIRSDSIIDKLKSEFPDYGTKTYCGDDDPEIETYLKRAREISEGILPFVSYVRITYEMPDKELVEKTINELYSAVPEELKDYVRVWLYRPLLTPVKVNLNKIDVALAENIEVLIK